MYSITPITNKIKPDTVKKYNNSMKFIKTAKNAYNLTFTLENNNIVLSNIINFELINLIYTLNPDIYESIQIEKISDNESNIVLVMKKFIFDLISQKYAFLNTTKNTHENTITFISTSIIDKKPSNITDKMELVQINKIVHNFEIISSHKINVECEFMFSDDTHIPSVVDNILGIIVNKIFIRVKTFIENLK